MPDPVPSPILRRDFAGALFILLWTITRQRLWLPRTNSLPYRVSHLMPEQRVCRKREAEMSCREWEGITKEMMCLSDDP